MFYAEFKYICDVCKEKRTIKVNFNNNKFVFVSFYGQKQNKCTNFMENCRKTHIFRAAKIIKSGVQTA